MNRDGLTVAPAQDYPMKKGADREDFLKKRTRLQTAA